MGALELLRHEGVRKLPMSFKFFIVRRFGLMSGGQDRMIVSGGKKYLSMHVPHLGSMAFDRFVDAHVRESRGERVPEIVNISVTPRCEGNCWHCLYSGIKRKREEYLDVETIGPAVKEMAEMGAYSVLLTGGDPLLHPGITDIVELFDDRFVVNIATPGVSLKAEMARRLKKAGLTGVFVGLDSPNKEKNDEYRGAGSYEAALSAIKAAGDAGLLTGIFSVLRREQLNDGEIERLMGLARDLHVSEVDLFEPVGPRGELLTLEERAELASDQENYNRKKGYPKVISGPYMDSPLFMGCTAGFNRLFIDYTGDVRPCQLLPVSYGNIKETGLREIWERMRAFDRPGSRCLFFENYDIISGMARGGGLTPEECAEMCPKREREIPLYYRKLGIR